MASSSSSFSDPYLDPDTGILRNLVGARTQADLDDAEFDLVHAAEIALREVPPRQTLDLSEWRSIHKALFGDVYEWAGQLRTVDIAKASGGIGFEFMNTAAFVTAIPFVEDEIKSALDVDRLEHSEFVKHLAEQYCNLNVLHPFREGNGRTQRFFWNRVAQKFGHRLNWQAVSQDENTRASAIAAASLNYGPLLDMFQGIAVESAHLGSPLGWIDFTPAASRAKPLLGVVIHPICAFSMPRARKPCALRPGHAGHHRSKIPLRT